ncbi:MAG: hypothetical protein JKY19_07125 [Alcanivoracaceae bacterium]|nr:hypothetical protein [Alcanivoracaceae bacterium]
MPDKKTTKKTTTAAKSKQKKQAVVIIHGIGEQKPMDTTWGFVKSMWIGNKAIHKPHTSPKVWSKPVSGELATEMKRLTTGYNKNDIGTDFFEFYYQHMIKDTRVSHVMGWAKTLLFRKPASVPKPMRSVYWLLWILLVTGLALVISGVFDDTGSLFNTQSFFGLVVISFARFILTKIVGDAARYLLPAPENLEIRDQVRKAGAKLLLNLSSLGKGSPQGEKYYRIIVMGHSLGSVVAYDIIQQAWLHHYASLGDSSKRTKHGKARAALEAILGDETATWKTIQPLQRAYYDALKDKAGTGWRIEHLITCGSPLAHADLLLAHDRNHLNEKIARREMSICPPLSEGPVSNPRFSYSNSSTNGNIPHHAAPFAATRWSNLYFPCKAIIKGDIVGGPVVPLFGPGIRDVPVESSQQYGLLLHTLYWHAKTDDAKHLQAFQEVLDLIDAFGKKMDN